MKTWVSGLQNLAAIVGKGWMLALTHPFLILLRYVCNAALAWLLLKPFLEAFAERLDRSVLRESLADGIPISLVNFFAGTYDDFFDAAEAHQVFFLVLFVLIGVYFSGGIIHCLWRRSGPRGFFEACQRHFLELLGILAFTLVMYVVGVGIPIVLFAYGLNLYNDWSELSVPTLRLVWWGGVVLIVLMMGSAVVRVKEYARLMVCEPNQTTPFYVHFWRALVFTRRHHVATFFLLMGFLAFHPLLIWAFDFLPREGGQWWTAILVGQGLIVARIAASLATQQGQLLFLQQHCGAADSVEPTEEEEEALRWERHDVLDEFPDAEPEPGADLEENLEEEKENLEEPAQENELMESEPSDKDEADQSPPRSTAP